VTDVAEAESLILEHMQSLSSVVRPLSETIGCVLQEEVLAERDLPPFNRVTMDGIAIKFNDWEQGLRRYHLVGSQGAGVQPLTDIKNSECIKIMTGAMLPDTVDTVIPIEQVTINQKNVLVESKISISKGQFIHSRGSDRKIGSNLLSPGNLIGPPEMAILASAGYSKIKVSESPLVACISTGDELVNLEEKILPHQIRSSNEYAIEASLERHCRAKVTRENLKDDPKVMLKKISDLHDKSDVVILSGGVSMGDYDFVPEVLNKLGARPIFHRIEQRPGRPMWFGISKDHKPIFGLPGNPVSTLVCLTRYVIPGLQHAMGLHHKQPETTYLAEEVVFKANLAFFLPVKLKAGRNGISLAHPCPTNTSGDFVSLAQTTGFIELPRKQNRFSEGTVTKLFRW
tara:strand:+ start:2885 stop:4084 length:1200 start_codon:yes stop_codon:yes gene_type:complete